MKDDENLQNAAQCGPRLLYNYTTQAGLLGILESKSIWATHLRHLNDSSELQLGIEMFQRGLADLKVNREATGVYGWTSFPEDVTQKIEESLREAASSMIHGMSSAEVFATSFFDSAKSVSDKGERDPGDTLEQWRAYSGGSGGFSIGFDKEALEKHVASLTAKPRCVITCGSCNYRCESEEESVQKGVQEIGDS